MKHTVALTLAAAVAIAATSTSAQAQASSSDATLNQPCEIGYVTGVGGSAQSLREYLASANKYRYLADNPIQCKVSQGQGRTSDCTGVTNLKHEQISVFDDSDPATMTVVARVELDQGTYPASIVVRRQDVQCEH